MDRFKAAFNNEFNSDNAKENTQILITVIQILAGLLVGIIGASVSAISASLSANAWLAGVAALFCIGLPMLSKFKTLCSSNFLRQFSFYLLSLSIGIVLIYSSLIFDGFFYGLWLYLGTALMLYYEYNGIRKCELKQSFKFVVFGLVVISFGLILVICLVEFNIFYVLLIVSAK